MLVSLHLMPSPIIDNLVQVIHFPLLAPLHHRFGRAPGRPPIEPGRTARVVGLVNRRDLNGGQVTIKSFLNNGRVECEIIHLENTAYETRESIAIRPQNLEVNYNVAGREWGQGIEECPICLDTKMDTTTNASIMECW